MGIVDSATKTRNRVPATKIRRSPRIKIQTNTIVIVIRQKYVSNIRDCASDLVHEAILVHGVDPTFDQS